MFMRFVFGVQKLARSSSLMGIGLVMLFSTVAFGSTVKPKKASKSQNQKVSLPASQKISLNRKGIKVLSEKDAYPMAKNYTSPVLLVANTSFKKKSLIQQNSLTLDQTVEDGKIISGSLSISHSQSMVDFQDGSRQDSQSLGLQISSRLGDNWTASVGTSLSQDNRDVDSSQNGNMSDTTVSLSRKSVKMTDSLKAGYSFSSLVPTSKYSSKFQNLQGTIGASVRLGFNEDVLSDGFDLSFGIGATRLFHKYETDKAGTVLNQYSLRETVSASYSYKDFSISADISHRHGWTYQNNVKQAYEASQEISYSISPTWGVSLGHTNSEAWLKPNGQDSNLKLIDENSSIVYVSTSVMF